MNAPEQLRLPLDRVCPTCGAKYIGACFTCSFQRGLFR